VEVTEGGEVTDSKFDNDKWAFLQDYTLAGPASMILAAESAMDRTWLERGTAANEKRWDSRPEFEGYYENADADFGNPWGKGF
jgi:hypothetical protein